MVGLIPARQFSARKPSSSPICSAKPCAVLPDSATSFQISPWAAVAERAQKAGVVYCIEPLSSDQTPLINTLEEAAALVTAIGNRSVRTMLDCSSAGRMEIVPLPALIDTWLPKGMIAHVQVNDRNRRGPGQGEQRFAPLLAALVRHKYAGDIAVKPFDYVPDGPGAAARAIGYIRGILEALQEH